MTRESAFRVWVEEKNPPGPGRGNRSTEETRGSPEGAPLLGAGRD